MDDFQSYTHLVKKLQGNKSLSLQNHNNPDRVARGTDTSIVKNTES